jgi:hypothetical protein
MAGSRTRPPASGQDPTSEGPDFTHQEAAEYIASLLEGLKSVANGARMPFLAYLINVALEEARSEKEG